MKETQDLWPKGQRVKSSKCMGICAVGGKFKGCFVQQCVGILKSYIAYTVEPRWPQISVEVLDAEENDTVLPTLEHEGADDRWACLWFLRPVNQHSYLTSVWHHISGPWGCDFPGNPNTAGDGFFFCAPKRRCVVCYRSSIILLLQNLNRFLVLHLGQGLNLAHPHIWICSVAVLGVG